MRGKRRLHSFGILGLVLVTLTALLIPPQSVFGAAPLTLPTGFADEALVSGLLAPRAWVWTPDGRILIAERGSASTSDINVASVRVFKNGALLPTRAVSFGVCGDGERGFLGLVLDPNFTTNGYLYTYYTRFGSPYTCGYNRGDQGPRNRVSRWTMVGDTISPASELVLLDNIPADSGIHNSGDMHFGADGNLYITTGDGGSPPSPAANTGILGGKVLRIKPDNTAPNGYTIPTDNPFEGVADARLCGLRPQPSGTGPCREIFAYGFRNPFRMAIKPGTSTPYTFDVGGGYWEEINEVVRGGNYGYPVREGPCPSGTFCGTNTPSGYNDPIFSYPHANPQNSNDAAIIGGAFYTGNGYPAEYASNLFYADYVRGWIRRLVPGVGNSWSDQPFASGGSGLIGLRTGPDGNLYYLTVPTDTTGEIRRISYAGAVNLAPNAQISANPPNGPLSTTFTFSADGSSDPEGGTLTYHWDFGDGTNQTTTVPTANKVYNSAGPKIVTLTVTDNGQPPATSPPATITVYPGNAAATGTIVVKNVTDPARSLYHAGDTWTFEATDLIDDNTAPGDIQVKWTIDFHHRDHHHPAITEQPGQSVTLNIPQSGEYDYVVWYRVYLLLTDSQGQTSTVVREIFPQLTTVTVGSNPPGATMVVDGGTITATQVLTRVINFAMSVNALSPQQIGGGWHYFSSWSDGGEQVHAIPVPLAGGTYTANYTPGDAPTATPTNTPTNTPIPPTNLLKNGDFELGTLAFWEVIPTISATTTGRYAGQYGAVMNGDARLDQTFSTTPGQTYYVAARIRIDEQMVAPSWGGLKLNVVNSTWSERGAATPLTTANSPVCQWTRVEFSFVADTTTSRVLYDNFSGGGQFRASIDNIVVSSAPIPSDGPPTVTICENATATPTYTPSNTPTNTPSNTPTNTPSNTPTYTPTNTPSNTPTNTPSNTPTYTPTNTPSNTPTNTPTNTPSNTPTNTPSNTPTNTPSNTPTNTPSNTPSNTPTNTPSNTPTNTPTGTITITPTNTPTNTPSNTPTNTPTNTPSNTPTNTPTIKTTYWLYIPLAIKR